MQFPFFRPKATSLLFQRLTEAIHQSQEIWIELDSDSFSGTPLALDQEWLELMVLVRDEEEPAYHRTVWLIRLDAIVSVAYPTQSWSQERLEALLPSEKPES